MAENTTNLSKIKREHLLEICSRIKNKEEVESFEINELEQFIRSMKYGLLFEEHEEQIDIKLKDNIPIFIEDVEKEIKTSTGHYNFLLEGDNLHSLKLLEKTHKNSVDVIYIDPPYNTGNEFVYNDKIIGKEDGYKHSKWLSFMQERLLIAHKLLSKQGVIFISIDDHEYANLKLLCDDIFGEENFIDAIIWQKTENIKMDSKFLSQNKDFVLVYRKTDELNSFTKQMSDTERFKLKDEKGIYYLRKLDSLSSSYSRGMDYIIEHDGVKYYPGGSEEKWIERQSTSPKKKAPTWLWSKEKYEQGLINGEIVFKNGNVYNKVRYDGIAKKPYINIQKIVSQQTAQKELNFMLGERNFDHPKPPQLIKWLIALHPNKSATILDFFAGSGTTGHAVLELNQEDEGNRKFILCTNNENNICEEVTYQRLKTVITGIRTDGTKYSDGIPANLKYFKAEFLDKDNEDLDEELLDASIQLIELENFEDVNSNNTTVFVAENDNDLDEFENKFDPESNTIKKVYVAEDVCLSASQYLLFKKYQIEIKTIPTGYFKEI